METFILSYNVVLVLWPTDSLLVRYFKHSKSNSCKALCCVVMGLDISNSKNYGHSIMEHVVKKKIFFSGCGGDNRFSLPNMSNTAVALMVRL